MILVSNSSTDEVEQTYDIFYAQGLYNGTYAEYSCQSTTALSNLFPSTEIKNEITKFYHDLLSYRNAV